MNQPVQDSSRRVRLESRLLFAAVALVLTLPGPGRAAVEACFPSVTPSLSTGSYLLNDTGFSQTASKYVFNTGTTPDGELWMGQDASYLWLGVVAHGSTCPPKRKAVVVVLFDIPGSGSQHDYRRLIVRPNPLGSAIASPPSSQQVASQADEYEGTTLNSSGRVAWGSPSTLLTTQSDIYVSADGTCTGTTGSWYLEMRVDRSKLGVPAGGNFRMYVDIMRTDDNVNWLTPLVWPFNPSNWSTSCDPSSTPCAIGGTPASSLLDDNSYPAPGTWGTATLGTSGCGISFTGGDNTNRNPDLYVTCTPSVPPVANSDCDATYQNWPNLLISLTDPSVFHALIHNASAQATTVQANYSWADFGIQAYQNFQPLPSGAGTNLSWNIGAGGTTKQDTLSVATSAWPSGVLKPNEHICTRLELTGGSVPYQNQAAMQNMDFAPLSAFNDVATLDTGRYEPPPAGRTTHHFTLRQSADASLTVSDGRVPRIPRNHIVEQFVWVLRSARASGRYIVIDGSRFELTEPASFGYVLQHDLGIECYWPDKVSRPIGAAAATTLANPRMLPCSRTIEPKAFGVLPASLDHFQFSIKGEGVRRVGNGDAEIDVPPGQKVKLSPSVEYVPPKNGCSGCPRIPTPTWGLLALGLAALAPRRRRRSG